MTRYEIVPERSRVRIRARSSLHPIHSESSGIEGWIDLELDGEQRVNVARKPTGELSFPVAQLRSGNPVEDRELQRRIDASHFRTIDGRMTGIESTGTDGTYRVRGDVTFRGVTRNYEDGMTITPLDERTIRLTGERVFDIRDFGMAPPRILFFKVEPDVRVEVELVAVREG
jgi:polyisoprenoid-binding protein YceI